MVKVSTLAIAAGSLVLAGGAGLYMQINDAGPQTTQVAALTAAPELEPAQISSDMQKVELDEITLTSSELPAQLALDPEPVTEPLFASDPDDIEAIAPVLAALDDTDVEPRPVPMAQPDPVATTETCLVDMTGNTRAAAMVALHLVAPCYPNARVDFTHEGMTFSALTNAKGVVDVIVPALAENATFLAMFDMGNGAAVELEVDTLPFYDRSVVMWTGDAGVGLHALEFGADWDSEGHVWSGAPRDSTIAALGEGGFMTRLGDPALEDGQVVEVYTFPTGTARVAGDVALSVEVEVTDLNCNRDLHASVIEVEEAKASKPGQLMLTVPDCDAVGDFIQLKNLVQDLKIAVR